MGGGPQSSSLIQSEIPPRVLAITDEFFFNGGQFLFEACKVLVERPHEGLVRPKGGVRAFPGAGARGTGVRAVPGHLIDEALQPAHGLSVRRDVLQHGAQAVLRGGDEKQRFVQTALDHKACSGAALTLVR